MPRNRATVLRLLLPLAVTAGGATASLEAQTVPSPYRFVEPRQEIGVFVGHLDMGRGRFDLGPEPGVLAGARYGIRVSGAFALEGTISYQPTTRDVLDPRRAEGNRLIGETDASILVADARLRFSLTGQRTWNELAPHLIVGGGFATDLAGDPGIEDDDRTADERFDFGTAVTGLLGGGLRWIPSDRFLIRSDALFTLWKLDIPQEFRGLDPANVAPEDEWVSGLNLTVGVSYIF